MQSLIAQMLLDAPAAVKRCASLDGQVQPYCAAKVGHAIAIALPPTIRRVRNELDSYVDSHVGS